jgi:hypothetical protein
VVFGLGFASGAGAAVQAGPGETFITTYLELPEGATAAATSGVADDDIYRSPMSADGRYVAFASAANALDRAANPDVDNIYRKDRNTGEVVLVSRANGANSSGPARISSDPRISDDGNLVAFVTDAGLDPADSDGVKDVYVRDVGAGTTTLATPGTSFPVEHYDLSANGQFVAFSTADTLLIGDINASTDVYRRNLGSGAVNLVSRIPAAEASGNGAADDVSISGDGRWVAFASTSTNLVLGFADSNGGSSSDVFARDMQANVTYLVSKQHNIASAGANGDSSEPRMAGTPALVGDVKIAFVSRATNLADNGVSDSSNANSVYLRPLSVLASVLVSRNSSGQNADSRAHSPSISDDGNLVNFASDAQNLAPDPDYYAAYVRNVSNGTTTMISADNEYAVEGDISGDGSFVTWVEEGGATPDSDPDIWNVFGRPAVSGPIELVSRPAGSGAFVLSGANVYTVEESNRGISADGRYVVFNSNSSRLPGANGGNQVYRRDLQTGEIELVSRANGANGAVAEFGGEEASISADGSRVAFTAYGSLDPVDPSPDAQAYMRDLNTDTTYLVSRQSGAAGAVANAASSGTSISGDGDRVSFQSDADNLGGPGGDQQIYVRDIASGQTIIASRASGPAGAIGNNDSERARLSGDGEKVAFLSRASNLHPDDASTNRDVYLRDLAGGDTVLISRQSGLAGTPAAGFSTGVAISADGSTVAFRTEDQTVATEAGAWPPGTPQVVARNVASGQNTLVSRAPGGAAADSPADSASISGDGSRVAFASDAQNLLPGLGGKSRSAVFVRDMATGALSGPPSFGLPDNEPQQGSRVPSISDSGECLSYNANGYNPASGDASDIYSDYIYVVSGSCSNPALTARPNLSNVKVTPKKFAVSRKKTARVAATTAKKRKKAKKGTKISFRLSVNARVTVRIDRQSSGRKVRGKCRKVTKKNKAKKKCRRYVKAGKLVRKNLKPGRNVVRFSGRIGKKALKPGRYRASLTAYNPGGSSKTVRRPFRVVRR